MMTGFEGPGEKAFRGFLKDHYHQPSDDLKLPFDWDAGALFAKVNYYTVMGLANGAERPSRATVMASKPMPASMS